MARRRRQLSGKEYKTEAELCADFRAWLEDHSGWIAYNETAGWDMLAVFRGTLQIGIQAKLRPTFRLIEQALDGVRYRAGEVEAYDRGPHYRAVLVPHADQDAVRVFRRLRVILLTPRALTWQEERDGFDLPVFQWRRDSGIIGMNCDPFCPDRGLAPVPEPGWLWGQKELERLPEFVPDTPAGVPCPKILSGWKIRMLRVVVIAHERGRVTCAEAREHKIDLAPWVNDYNPARSRFIRIERGVYALGPAMTYHLDFPQTFEKLLEEFRAKPAV